MALNSAQLATLKSDINADPTLSVLPISAATSDQIMGAYNADASPDYWVWKPSITEHDITDLTSVDATVWSWPAYIARSQAERDGWARMFNGTFTINPSLAQVRQGIADIFSGSTTPAVAQRTHLSAIGRRKATRAEKLFAVGNGTTATPSVMGYVGKLTQNDVTAARELV